jgi:antirestriction protein ArdC
MKQLKKAANQSSIYQKVTDEVIQALEKGTVPWKRNWNVYGPPRNITNGHTYQGWNIFYLNFVTLSKGYKTPFFITFKQANALGGHIRKGEKGYPVIYWKRITTDLKAIRKDTEEGEEPVYGKSRMILREYTVFNIDQTEKIAFALPEVCNKTPKEKIDACEHTIKEMPNCPPIRHGGDRAFYSFAFDFVQMPNFDQFPEPEYYYQTIFHELIHSTGHPCRLNRKDMECFSRGDERYAKEELTAELGSAYLCAYHGIEQKIIGNSASYVDYWLQRLQNDKTLLLKAASQGQAGANYILNHSGGEKEEAETTQSIAV